MEQIEFTVDGYTYKFRIAKMNALDVLAMQTQQSFSNMTKSRAFLANILEHVETLCGETWIPVKTAGKEIYFPAELTENVELMNEIIGHFINDFFKPVFQKSSE